MPKSGAGFENLPAQIPLFPLEGVLLLPDCDLPLNIFEPRYLAMIDFALASHRMIGMIQPKLSSNAGDALEAVGCVGRVAKFAESGDGRYLITLRGVSRFVLDKEVSGLEPFRSAEVAYVGAGQAVSDKKSPELGHETILRMLGLFERARGIKFDLTAAAAAPVQEIIDALCMRLPLTPAEKQALLEAADAAERCRILVAIAELELAGKAEPGSRLQ